MRQKLFWIFIGWICSCKLFAQIEVPIVGIPTSYNGGFAGEAGVPRITTFSFLRGSNGIHGVSYANYISFDNFFKKIRSGISVTAGQSLDRWYSLDGSDSAPHTDEYLFRIAISPKLSFKGKYTLAPFIDFSLYDLGRYNYWNNSKQPVTFYDYHRSSVLARVGLLVNSTKAYIGLTIDNAFQSKIYEKKVNTPGFFRTINPFGLILQAGYTFQRFPDSKFSFTPQIAIGYHYSPYDSWRYSFTFHDISLMARYKKFIVGLNYPGIALGYQNDRFKIVLSQFPGIRNYVGGLSIRYKFNGTNTSHATFTSS